METYEKKMINDELSEEQIENVTGGIGPMGIGLIAATVGAVAGCQKSYLKAKSAKKKKKNKKKK